jgi:metallo-beta-lactamase family protein
MQIKFLGASGTVTGSSYVLTSGSGKSILIDLGMFQGTEEIDKLNYQPFDFDCSQLLGIILTHAHLDHCGRLPIVIPRGFTGNIWMTEATSELTELSLIDSAKIARQDQREDRKILYDRDLAIAAINRFTTVDYHQSFTIADFTITMRDAGHILGSASLEIVDRNPDSEVSKIVFSGDLGNSPENLVRDTEFFDRADAVVMESTYGNRLHPTEVPMDSLQREINETEKDGGTLLIPSFSLDRTQVLLHMIKHLKEEGKVASDTAVFLDGPMGQRATKIYLRYGHIMNPHTQTEMQETDPFYFPGLSVVHSHQESEGIMKVPGPKVIIAGSGMMNGGRIVRHASRMLGFKSTRLFIVGYQAEETLGREILDGSRHVTIDDHEVDIQATISHTEAMSSHADQRQLMDWLAHVKGVKKLFLTHGEDVQRSALSTKIKTDLQITDIAMPHLGDIIRF